MKTLIKVLLWIVILTSPLWIVFLFAYSAINYNFWPPNCGIIPKLEPRRVCEFSKLDKAPKGKPAMVTFWVSVPEDIQAQDKILLAIAGQEPVEMEKVGDTSWQKTVTTTTGSELSYQYFKNSSSNLSDNKKWQVKSLDKKVYDYVAAWNGAPLAVNLPKRLVGVQMKDTWTINYNMNLFEDTRRNLDTTMARAKALGANDFGVFSFIDMAGEKDNFTVAETTSPYYHWRDAAITGKEMKQLVKKGKKYGLGITLHYNIGADYNKYYSVNPFSPQAGSGLGGNAAEDKAGKDFGRNEPKTKEWLSRYFNQLKPILVKWATDAEAAGITAIDVTPQYRPPSVAPLEDYADEQFQDIIKAMREVYHGKIYASNFSKFGGFSSFSKIPNYANDVDGLFIYSAELNVSKGASIAAMKQAHSVWLDQVEQLFASYQPPIFMVLAQSSYDGVNNGKPGMEWGDHAEAIARGYKENWQDQADSYEAFLAALNGRTKFAGVLTGGYWWDDLMAPKYIGTLNNMESTIRSKPAEAVWKKWLLVPITN